MLRQRIKTKKVVKRVRAMAGVRIRELERKLPREILVKYEQQLELFQEMRRFGHFFALFALWLFFDTKSPQLHRVPCIAR